MPQVGQWSSFSDFFADFFLVAIDWVGRELAFWTCAVIEYRSAAGRQV
jgi:hypothetical protein